MPHQKKQQNHYPPLILLAGGFSTRLKPVLKGAPKALAPITEKPFIYYAIKNYEKQGIQEFYLSLHHEAEKIVSYINQECELKHLKINFCIEPEPLDTGGAIRFVLDSIKNKMDFYFVANADTYQKNPLSHFFNSPQYLKESLLGLTLVEKKDTSRFGTVSMNQDDQITAFYEKSFQQADSLDSSALIYSGICLLMSREILAQKEKRFSLEKDLFIKLKEKNKLFGVLLPEKFIDIGIPEDYYKFIQEFKAEQ